MTNGTVTKIPIPRENVTTFNSFAYGICTHLEKFNFSLSSIGDNLMVVINPEPGCKYTIHYIKSIY